MNLTFLGTGTSQGVPVISCKCPVCSSDDPRDKRLRTSALLTMDNGDNLLFDIGPDFREQMLREGVSHLEGILVTHAHRDHVAGLDDVRAFNYVQHQRMDVYANAVALNIIHHDYGYIFAESPYPGLPQVNLHEVSDAPFFVGVHKVVPISAMHLKMPVTGYRIGDLTYITDASYISAEELVKMRNSKVLVINALRHEKHFSHFCLSEALDVIRQVAPEQAYLTHLSHEYGRYADSLAELPSNVHIAYDRLSVDI